MPTAYVTGNPVECVIHPEIWNKSKIWDPQAVGQIYEDQYEEEYVGYPIESVSTTLSTNPDIGRNVIGLNLLIQKVNFWLAFLVPRASPMKLNCKRIFSFNKNVPKE